MHYYSTRSKNEKYSFREASLEGLAPDGGLFVPCEIPRYDDAVKSSLGSMAFTDIAYETIKPFVKDDIPDSALSDIVQSAFTFKSLLVPVADRYTVELFHGPTAAFKDFGARFMARAFSYLRRGEDRPLNILVATSGDTGGAVADGFFGIDGITVTVLYPKGRVSPLQERQIAGLGKNISAIAVEGSFDDCQRLVKTVLADENLKKKMNLSSANSINISRLIPQAVYYSSAAGKSFSGNIDEDEEATPRIKNPIGITRLKMSKWKEFPRLSKRPITLCVPSGNFGNLTAGLYSMKMGAPIALFAAATNINKTIPDYLESGEYLARISQATISNAMDVGAPSNFERMAAHFTYEEMKNIITGVYVTDSETTDTIKQVYEDTGYYLDPHSAVGWKGIDKLSEENKLPYGPVGVLCTAHPAKFCEIVEPITGKPETPESLARAMEREINAQTIPADVNAFRDIIASLRWSI